MVGGTWAFWKDEIEVKIMARNKRWLIVAYDVRDPKRLRLVAKHLEGYGERIQYSIFRCHLSERDIERLRWELVKILSEEDSLIFIGLCDTCASKISKKAINIDWPDKVPNFEVI